MRWQYLQTQFTSNYPQGNRFGLLKLDSTLVRSLPLFYPASRMESFASYSQRDISVIVMLRNSPLNFKSGTITPPPAVNPLLCNCYHLTTTIRYDACHRPSPERDSRCINPASHQENPG